MRNASVKEASASFVAMVLVALAGCHRPAATTVSHATTASPAVAVSTPVPATTAETAPAAAVAPPSADVQQVAAGAERTAKQMGEPALSAMKLARPPSKMGVPVDLSYQFDGDVKDGQPVTLHLAAVPRVAGSNLTVSIKSEAGISTPANPLKAQKADVSAAYRQQVAVTKAANGPKELRVLVTMDLPDGSSAHSWFSVPFETAVPVEKSQAAKRARQE